MRRLTLIIAGVALLATTMIGCAQNRGSERKNHAKNLLSAEGAQFFGSETIYGIDYEDITPQELMGQGINLCGLLDCSRWTFGPSLDWFDLMITLNSNGTIAQLYVIIQSQGLSDGLETYTSPIYFAFTSEAASAQTVKYVAGKTLTFLAADNQGELDVRGIAAGSNSFSLTIIDVASGSVFAQTAKTNTYEAPAAVTAAK